jgi:tricarballylate dehydrogenase
MSTTSPRSGQRVDPIDDYDVAVVGGGMAGLTAGIAAAEAGAAPVVLEKAPKKRRGGHLQYTETFRIPTAEIDVGLEFHIPDYSASDFYQDIMHVTDGHADPELAQRMVTAAGPTFEWLHDHLTAQGFEWQTEPDRTMYAAGRIFHDGERLTDKLVAAAEAAGAEVLYEAEAREIRQAGTNEVSGLRALVANTWTEFDVDSLVLACGGYESSPEKRATYYGETYDDITVRGSRYNTGEALEMAMDAGAASAGQWSGAHMTVIDAGSPKVEGGLTPVSGYQYGVILNHDGERFLDEGEDTRAHTYAKFGRKVFEQPYHEAFVIQDARTNEYVLHTGPTDPITADSIEELVARLDIEQREQAIRTFNDYNDACDPDAEIDPAVLDGNRTEGTTPAKSNWAVRLDETPLVGYPVTGGITFAFGGVAQTPDAEVLDTSNEPIPGFYAAGNATGGLFVNNYPGGTGLTNAAVYGKIAGENAAADATE